MTNTEITPYAVVVIKPISINRGHGPDILRDILDDCGLVLNKIRSWNVCPTTWSALCSISKDTESEFELIYYQGEHRFKECWVLLLTHKDRITNPHEILNTYCGPCEDFTKWKTTHLRHRYGTYLKSDDVVYISPNGKQNLIANLLFSSFNEEDI